MMSEFGLPDFKELWKIRAHERPLFQKKKGVTRVLFFILLKHFQEHFRFPENVLDISEDLVFYAQKVFGEEITAFDLEAKFNHQRVLNRFKQSIRQHEEVQSFNPNDQSFIGFLEERVLKEKTDEALMEASFEKLRKEKIELPDEGLLKRLIQTARKSKESWLFKKINEALSEENKLYIEEIILSSTNEENLLQFLRQGSGSSNRKGIDEEITRLKILENLPFSSFDFMEDVHRQRLSFYKRRFLTDTPTRTKRRSHDSRYGLAAVFLYLRYIEANDNLVDHLMHTIHQIKKTKDRRKQKFEKEVSKTFGILESLYQVAEINLEHPKEIIEEAVYPKIPRSVLDEIIQTKNLVKKKKTIIQEGVIKSYSNRYRHLLFKLLDAIKISSKDEALLKALSLIQKYRGSKSLYFPEGEKIPLKNFISAQDEKIIVEQGEDKILRILKKSYECAVFKILRLKLKHKEAWVEDSLKYQNPKKDFPSDFEDRKKDYFELLDVPLEARLFTDALQKKMEGHIKAFDESFPENEFVSLTQKKGKPWIVLTPLQKAEEPKLIGLLKQGILNRWGIIDLLDVLKEVDLREHFTSAFKTAGNREILDKSDIQKRLLLCFFSLGTNTGFKRTAGASQGAVSLEELRHIKRFFVNKEDLREAIDIVINAIFKIRNPTIWKSKSTACAADSKQFGCYSQNLMSEWSPRHHAEGVMIYWHVSDQYICVYSQIKTCTSSEVASMLQGIINQESDMEIEAQYVDSHGKSDLGFALSYLEKFDLLPRYKTIGAQKLYLPSPEFKVTHLSSITTRCINWELIKENYEELIKYAVALKIGTATAETLIRKFSRTNYQHPVFKAFMELGKAVKTIFLCRYLSSLELRQQINAGLNVVENWNSANEFIFYGKSGEITSNQKEDQELSMLCLQLLQNCIVYINTLLIEELLQSPSWTHTLEKEDYRALTALFYLHINPYGTFDLDLSKRLSIQSTGGRA